MPVLSERLRRLRQLFGYSQEYVAFNLGITQPAYCKWESGQSRPPIDKLEHIATLYQISIGELLSGSETEILNRLMADKTFAEKLFGRTSGT